MGDLARVKDKVQSILAAKFTATLTERGGFGLRNGSAQLTIDVVQRGDVEDGPVWITFLVPVLWDVPISNELYRYVALHADDYMIGHLSAFENDRGSANLFLSHSLLGDYLDEEELVSTIVMTLGTGDDLDDELQRQFGGRRTFEDD
jgi:hypothetical protein